MALFKKKTEPAAARRRPAATPDGSRRGEMFSYYSRRSASSSNTGRLDAATVQQAAQAVPASKASTRPWLSWSVAAVIIIAFIFLTGLSGSSHVIIENGGGSEYFTQDASAYQQALAGAVHSSLLDKNKLTFDAVKLRQDIKREYPEIKTVNISLPLFGNAPTVVLTPYRAEYLLTTPTGGSYVLDEAGHAVMPASQLPSQSSLHLPILQDKSSRSISLNKQAIASTTVNFVDTVRAVLTSQHVAITSLSLPANASELDVAVNGKPYIVKFNLEGDPRLQAGTFVATKDKLERDGTVPTAYIDVRVPERAYFK